MISTISDILDELQHGRMIILVDDEDRENEGDLVIPASLVKPESVNFMATHGRGLICLALTAERIRELSLPPMTEDNTSPFETAFHVSIEARTGVTTGISAQDRARTVQVAADPACGPHDLVQPGHIFPLRARDGGVLVRRGQTEGSVDLCRLAGLNPAAVICEIMNSDGTMARMPQLVTFAAQHNIKICTIEKLVEYRRKLQNAVRRAAESTLPTVFGQFHMIAYETNVENQNYVALIKGDVDGKAEVAVRLHSECMTGDVFRSLRCDCGDQLHEALRILGEQECGVLVYMRQEGRGIGLVNKMKAYELQDQGLDTHQANIHLGFDPDPRDYGIGAQILKDLGVSSLRLISNNPKKQSGLEKYGLCITDRIPLIMPSNEHNARYLQTKREKFGHLISDDSVPPGGSESHPLQEQT